MRPFGLTSDRSAMGVLGAALISSLVIMAFSSSAVPVARHPHDVSMVALIANPAAYDGKPIRVTGFAVFEFETTALYLSKQDAVLGLDENSIALDTRRSLDELRELNGRFVFVSGIFEAVKDLRAGRLGSIQVLESVSPVRAFDGE